MNTLLAGLVVLVIGESHMSYNYSLLSALPDDLSMRGAKVMSFGACGASAADWLKTKPESCSGFRINTGPVRERPADIASTQPIGKLIDKYHPNLVVVVIGDTMASYGTTPMPKSWIWQGVSSLTKAIKAHGVSCAWVGPAWGEEGGKSRKTNKRTQEFSEYLATLVAPCTYIDSLKMSKPGEWKTKDGEHFTWEGYAQWGQGITDAIASPEIISTILN